MNKFDFDFATPSAFSSHAKSSRKSAAHERKMADVAVRDVESLSPEALWKDFVSTRTPVLIKGHIRDESWGVMKKWRHKKYLKNRAGDVKVKVEKRAGGKEKFGKGRKVAMKFGSFVEKISQGDETLYLSPQEAGVGVDGLPELISPPLNEFEGDFPLRPKLMGNLIPHQINVWMGNAKDGSSSGLHHDFHDNLYLLVKGKKRFKLFPPRKAPRMYTVGKISEIHENGRIVYESEKPTLSDGSFVEAAEEFEKMKAAKEALRMAEEEEDEEAIEKAEGELDALMDESLNELFDEVNSDEEEEEVPSCDDEEPQQDDEIQVDEENPLNFSRVDLSLSEKKLARNFPKFPKGGASYVAEVEEGNMLYLPAGWFHEVTSFNVDDSSEGHIAFNYWFHPPNNLASEKSAGFQKPYESEYWPSIWENRILEDSFFPEKVEPKRKARTKGDREANKGERRKKREGGEGDVVGKGKGEKRGSVEKKGRKRKKQENLVTERKKK